MKKILSILLALALMLGAAALAEGNVTIAVQGMNDFSDNIQSMIVYGDALHVGQHQPQADPCGRL